MSATITVAPSASTSARLVSMDAFRGFVMICLAADGFGFTPTAKRFPDSSVWKAIGYQFDHVQWVGCAFWDLIQPSFMFLVGMAVPFSFARRHAANESRSAIVKHVITRSLVLILLGLFLSSTGRPTTNFEFTNVLAQIGLGYAFLILLQGQGLIVQSIVAATVLGLYWAWFALTPIIPIENLEYQDLPKNRPILKGFEEHWQKHTNPAAQFDYWFLNLFPAAPAPTSQLENEPGKSAIDTTARPSQTETSQGIVELTGAALRRLVTRPEPYKYNRGGYQTLNFIPSYVTMLLGLITGEFIRRTKFSRKQTFATLLVTGLVLLSLGWVWQATGTCPLVKRIWTPSWSLFSTGWVLLILSGFYGIIDVLGWKSWAFPFVVAGMNSIVLYLSGLLLRGWIATLLKRHINDDLFNVFGMNYSAIVEKTLIMICLWLFAYWLYRRRVFVRI